MAKKDNQNARTSLEEFNDSLSSIEQKVEENKKYVYWTGGAVLAIVVLALIYIYGFRNPGIKNAKEDISKADMELFQGNDSLALKDYEKVAGEYSNSASNRANQISTGCRLSQRLQRKSQPCGSCIAIAAR